MLTEEHLPPLGRDLQARTVQGIAALFLRQLITLPVSLIGSILLARMLHPAEFGIFGIANFIVTSLIGCSDISLGAAFIQRAAGPGRRDLQTLFAFQLLVSITLYALLYALAPALTQFYHLEMGTVWVFRVLGLSLLLGIFATPSAIYLERKLAYRQFAIAELIQALAYQVLAVALAWSGFGVWSFVLAAMVAVLGRTLLLYAMAPWPIGLACDTGLLRGSLGFGGFVQLALWTAILRENLVALLAGPIFGAGAVGYLNWALTIAVLSSQIFTQLASRVLFPSLARLHADPEGTGRMVEKCLRFLMLGTLPLLGWLVVFMPEIVHYLYTDKWQAGIPAFYWYALAMVGGHFTTVLDAALKAAGQVKLSLRIMAVWAVALYLLATLFIQFWGFYGVAMAHGLTVWLAAGLLIYATSASLRIRYHAAVLVPGAAAVGMTLLMAALRMSLPHHLATALLLGVAGTGVYVLLLWAMEGRALVTDVQSLIALVRV